MRNWDLLDQEIAESLVVVVAQRLVRRLCEKCKREVRPSDKELRWLTGNGFAPPPILWAPVGCKYCNQIGYFGRVGVFELWRLMGDDYQAILRHRDEHSLRQALAIRRGQNIVNDAVQKVRSGLTSLQEVKGLGIGLSNASERLDQAL